MQSLAQPQSQRERPSLSRSPQAVQGAPVQEERQAPQSEVPQAEPADSSAFMGSAWKMGVLTDSVIRFKKPKRKKARAIAPLTKKPEEQNETLKEQRGLCCMVIPSCQRFNNIHCFLIFFYMLVVSQDICKEKKISDDCKKSFPIYAKYVTFIMLGLTVQGIAGMPLYILTVPFLDDSIDEHSIGLVLIPGGAFGQLLGGVIASKLQMYCKGRMSFTMVTSAISLVLVTLTMFVRCEPMPFAGITEDYNGLKATLDMTIMCYQIMAI
ncbi:Solute carrier organic anion transporter family member 4C1 [Myotis brandtii]|uniref:Solute carrier organic anion transporter family member 4C1 n=1 Tax=Myotis brandtii TaxID=109478 RepID=S7PIV0_MYOBR|nr:Solute carrier organic anion transporter family member 4C1 [Myotis brandtii]